MADSNELDDDPEKVLIFLGHFPSGSSIKDLSHFAQLVRNQSFSQLDYGTSKNIQIYGTTKPPDYDLSKIQYKVCLFAGKDDRLATVDDNRILRDILKILGS